MQARLCRLVLLWVTAVSLQGVALAQDVIYFDNGDRLTGTIERLERGELIFSTSTIDGDAAIDWRRIARIESERVFQFQTSDGERILGRIQKETSEGASDAEVVIVSRQEERRFRQEDIVLATQTGNRLNGLLEAEAGAGLAISKSNNQKQFNAETRVSYETLGYKTAATVSSIFSTQRETSSTSRHNLNVTFSKQLSKNWDATALADFLTSDEQQLDLRIVLGGGPSRTFVKNNRVILTAIGGTVWNSERYSPDSGFVPVNNQLEGLGGLQLSYFQFRQWTLESRFLLFPGITIAGRVRADWRTSLRVRLRRGKPLWWSFNQTLNLDNKPPEGAPGSDYVTGTSLSWSFP